MRSTFSGPITTPASTALSPTLLLATIPKRAFASLTVRPGACSTGRFALIKRVAVFGEGPLISQGRNAAQVPRSAIIALKVLLCR